MCFKRKGCLSRFCLIRPKGVRIKTFCPVLNCLNSLCDYPHVDQIRNKTDENTGCSGDEEYTYRVITHCEVNIKGVSYYFPVDYAKIVLLSEVLNSCTSNLGFRKYIGMVSVKLSDKRTFLHSQQIVVHKLA